MHVPTITRNQAGTYRCRVDHPVVKGRSKIKDIIVNVQSPPTKPTITLRPNIPFVGDNISLTCKSTAQRWPGNIPAHLSYQFIGKTRGESNNNRLIMNNLTKLDKGTNITCQATDDLEKVSNMSKTVILDPYYGPENVVVKPAIRSLNVTEGSALGPIHCIATCNPGCIYIWKQKMTGNFHPVKNEFISNNSVHVPTITRNQSGTYRCLVNHPEANNRTKIKDISVNVQYSPKITEIWLSSYNESYGLSTPTTFKFNEEVNVKITLRMESNPDPQILFNSSLLNIKIINTKINGYIDYISNLPSLKCEDSGNYPILARNGIPYADTRTVNLKICCKPRNATAESGTIGAKVGTEENIVLNVISFPAPNVTWLRVTNFEWTILRERYDYKHKINSKIHIRTEEDFGVYGIKICNQLGCVVENITLKPQDKPETPQNFSVETATFRSLNISWIAGFNGGHEQTFSVHYKATDDFKWDRKNVQTSNIRTGSTVYYTLDQLKPDTSYQVTVVSKNIHGQRNSSLEFKTEVEPTVKSPSKSASMTPIFIGIGCGSAIILMIVISVYMFFNRRNRGSTSELTESNVLYAAVDKVQQKFKRRNSGNEDSNMSNEPANAEYASVVKPKSKSKKVHYKEDEIETANDEYAVVDKSNKKIDYTENDNVYANQGDADLLIHHQPLKTKPSGRSKNKDGLTYIEVSFTRKPKNPRVIIGAENRTNYVDIDFTRTADPLPETADE
ncbi:neural cell adhesion molecule 2-like [Mytilus edulis]|uniref:neural cell adhesion molecule 2-like n=1 Tax=Mytilus edulis TaxID=6550 RepID=UPI0039F12A46